MKIRIYYEDTDCGNVVYYANYLKYMERGRTEYLRERDHDLQKYHDQGYIFAISEVQAKYRKSARYNDIIDVVTKLVDKSSITLTFESRVYNEKNELLMAGEAKMVCINGATGKACKMPQEMMNTLTLDR